MDSELENLKALYFSKDKECRELAQQIIKGNASLKKPLLRDVINLYNAVFGKKVARFTKTMRDKLLNPRRVKIDDSWVHGNMLSDLKYLNPYYVKVMQLTRYPMEGLNLLPDFVWGMSNLKELEIYDLNQVNIPKIAKSSNIRELKIFKSSVQGLENLPNSAEILVLNECNIGEFKYSYIKNITNLRWLYLDDNPSLDFDMDIFDKTALIRISLDGSDSNITMPENSQLLGSYTKVREGLYVISHQCL